ncbi:MAG: hypothetical protein GEU81_04430 [Nitriliruptorales bacterium]|nr:hypothetical protein [Nitriliruptorales bacterium]
MTDGPAALRDYLDELRRRTMNGDALSELDAQIMGSPDAITRIKLVEQRRQLAERRRSLEAGFVLHARQWSQAANVGRDAFLAEGVPADVLDRAGLTS